MNVKHYSDLKCKCENQDSDDACLENNGCVKTCRGDLNPVPLLRHAHASPRTGHTRLMTFNGVSDEARSSFMSRCKRERAVTQHREVALHLAPLPPSPPVGHHDTQWKFNMHYTQLCGRPY
ncbi:unnamed protein product [Arctia plantaginis]|uniref:Uncharacterized protein n=1 Tax=Arctia plantaginis TaxID=874455 RepID=A0A8S1ABM4_ARCPL|nr:unnamed protein product [Arctia plantaginis]